MHFSMGPGCNSNLSLSCTQLAGILSAVPAACLTMQVFKPSQGQTSPTPCSVREAPSGLPHHTGLTAMMSMGLYSQVSFPSQHDNHAAAWPTLQA